MTAPAYVHEADMGFTRTELLKGLATAVSPYEVTDPRAEVVEIAGQGRMVRLSTGADGFRAIASMRVPVLPVRLEFYDFDEDQYDAFMQRFKRYLHKGGG